MPRTTTGRSRGAARSPKPFLPRPRPSSTATPPVSIKLEPTDSPALLRKSSKLTIIVPPRPPPVFANKGQPWKHPDELEYIRPDSWNEDQIIEFLCINGFSVPARSTNANEPWVKVTSRDGDTTVLPRGYRLPLMFAAKFQWESLRLVMTSEARDEEWEDYKYDILHVARLCKRFLEEARSAMALSGMDRMWRCPTFDRALVRYYQRWLVNREEFVKDFWVEFEEEEYEKDVLKNDWSRFVLRGHKGFRLTREEVKDGLKYEDLTRGLGYVNGRLNWIVLQPSDPPLLQPSLPQAPSVPVTTTPVISEVVPTTEPPTSGPDPVPPSISATGTDGAVPSSLDDPHHSSNILNGTNSRPSSPSLNATPVSTPLSFVPSLSSPCDRTTPTSPSIAAADMAAPSDSTADFNKKSLEVKRKMMGEGEDPRPADENGHAVAIPAVSGPGATGDADGDARPAVIDTAESHSSTASRHPSRGADQGGDEGPGEHRSDEPEIVTPIKIPLGDEAGPAEKADTPPSNSLSDDGDAQEQAAHLSLPQDDVNMEVVERSPSPASSSRASSILSEPAYLAPLEEPAQPNITVSLSWPWDDVGRDDVEMEVVDPPVQVSSTLKADSTPSEPALLPELANLDASGILAAMKMVVIRAACPETTQETTLDLEEQTAAAAVTRADSPDGSLMSLETEPDEEADEERSGPDSGKEKEGVEEYDGHDYDDVEMGMAEPKSGRSSPHENGGDDGENPTSASTSRRVSPAARSRSRSLSGSSDTSPEEEHFMLSAAAWTSEPESADALYSDSVETAKAGPVQPPPLPSPVPLHAEPRSASCYPSSSRRNQNHWGIAAAMRRYGTAPLGNLNFGGSGGYDREEGEGDEEGLGRDPVVTKIVSVFRDTLEGLTDILTTVGSGREESVCSPTLASSISRRRGSMPVPLPPPPQGPARSVTPAASTSTPTIPPSQPQPQPPSTEARLIGELLVEIKSLQRTMQEDAQQRVTRDLEMQRMQTEMDDLRRQVLRMDRERRISSGSGITERQHAASPPSPSTPSTFSPLRRHASSSSALLPAQVSSPHPLSHLLAMDIDMAPAENGLPMSRDSTFVSSPSADSDLNGPLGDLQYPFAPGVRPPSPFPAPLAPARTVYPPSDLSLIPPLDIPLPIKSQRKQRAMFMAHPLRTVDNT